MKKHDEEGKKNHKGNFSKIKKSITETPLVSLPSPPSMVWRDDCFPVSGRKPKTSRSVPNRGWVELRGIKGERRTGKVKKGQHELQKMWFQDPQKAGSGE